MPDVQARRPASPNVSPTAPTAGLALRTSGAVVTPAGYARATCDAVAFFDDHLAEQRRVAIDVSDSPAIAVGPTGDIYVLHRDFGHEPDDSDSAKRPPHFFIVAYTATGAERWRVDFGTSTEWQWVVAGTNGPFLLSATRAILLAAETGTMGWTLALDHDASIVSDGADGVIMTVDGITSPGTNVDAQISHLAATGVAVWTRTLKTAGSAGSYTSVNFEDVALTADDGVVIAGSFTGPTLDLGERMIHATASPTSFVASLGPDGATRWAIGIGGVENLQALQVASVGDNALLGGEYVGNGTGLGLDPSQQYDSFVARVGANGIIHASVLGGSGDQLMDSLMAAADGTAVVTVSNAPDGDVVAVMKVGSRTFDDGHDNAAYVFDLDP